MTWDADTRMFVAVMSLVGAVPGIGIAQLFMALNYVGTAISEEAKIVAFFSFIFQLAWAIIFGVMIL